MEGEQVSSSSESDSEGSDEESDEDEANATVVVRKDEPEIEEDGNKVPAAGCYFSLILTFRMRFDFLISLYRIKNYRRVLCVKKFF